MTVPALQARNLGFAYGGTPVLEGVSFSVPRGVMMAVIGPNGAGKSTLFSILAGALAPAGGSVRLDGAPLPAAPERVARRGVGRTFQTARPFAGLSVLENLLLAAPAAGFAARWLFPLAAAPDAVARALAAEVGLSARLDRPAHALTHGEAKRLELAMVLIREPALLLMDEPTAGMAAAERAAFMDLVRAKARVRGLTVLFTEHDMPTVFGFAERILVLHHGRVIADGPPADIAADPAVRTVYLGGAAAP